jgi:hypothetical protein
MEFIYNNCYLECGISIYWELEENRRGQNHEEYEFTRKDV